MKSVCILNYQESQLPTLSCIDPQIVRIKIYTFGSLTDDRRHCYWQAVHPSAKFRSNSSV